MASMQSCPAASPQADTRVSPTNAAPGSSRAAGAEPRSQKMQTRDKLSTVLSRRDRAWGGPGPGRGPHALRLTVALQDPGGWPRHPGPES